MSRVVCTCGNTFVTRSTGGDIKVEICSACHPFYTGKQKLLDTARRVDKFQKRVEAAKKSGAIKSKTVKKAEQKAKQAKKKTKAEVEK